MNRDELKQYLPHREPMLLVDEVEVDAEGVCHGRYRVREDEFFCQGHFPENPIMPGVVQCEIMAQCCALIVKDELATHLPLYSGMNNVKFKNMVRPEWWLAGDRWCIARQALASGKNFVVGVSWPLH